MLLGTWHLLEVLVVELPCRRSWLEMARSCCRTFASGHVAMVIQQESNESGGEWRREVLRAVLVHGFVGPHTKAAVGPRQQAVRLVLVLVYGRTISTGHISMGTQHEVNRIGRYGSFYACASGGFSGHA